MAIYTTTLARMVNNLCEDPTASLQDKIKSARTKIFDFDYIVPSKIWEQPFKEYFEIAFINKYLFDEIGLETVARWQQRVYARLLEIMPKYHLIFSALEKVDLDTVLNDKGYTEADHYDRKNELASTTASESGSKSTNSTLPENMLSNGEIGNFAKVGYADGASISRSNSEATGESTNKETNDGTKTVTGRTISQLAMIGELGPDFNNYFSQFLNEFSDLFMSLYY